MLVEIMKINKEEVTVVTSLDVAETFGKEHKEVMRAIEGQKDSEGKTKYLGIIEQLRKGGELHLEKYYIPAEYIGDNGRKYRQYLMTRDGFTLSCYGLFRR